MRPVNDFLERRSGFSLIALGTILVSLLNFIDAITGYEILFSTYYLIPIGLVAWYAGRRLGILISVIAALAWLHADFAAGHFYSNPRLPYFNCATRFATFVILATLLPSLKSALERERSLSRTDPLTGVLNTRSFQAVAQAEIERARRYNRCFTMVFLDIDNFKAVNDSLGHTAGDDLLRRIATVIRENTRSTDSPARMGGDEFAILLPETDKDAAAVAVTKIQKRLLETMRQSSSNATFSIGVATFVRAPDNVEMMIQAADELMYSAKKGGKDRIQQKVFEGPADTQKDEKLRKS